MRCHLTLRCSVCYEWNFLAECVWFSCVIYFNNTCIYVLHAVFIYYTQGSHWKRKWCLAIVLRQLENLHVMFCSPQFLWSQKHQNGCGSLSVLVPRRFVSAQQPYRPHTHVNNQTAGLISCSCNWPAVASDQIRRVTSRRWWRQESWWSFDLPPEHSQTERQGTEEDDQGTCSTCPSYFVWCIFQNGTCDLNFISFCHLTPTVILTDDSQGSWSDSPPAPFSLFWLAW